MSTVFGKIIRGEVPCTKVFENDQIIAFNDIAPKAPVHVLIVPKKEIPCLQEVKPEDLFLVTEMLATAQKLAKELGIAEGYRIVINNGRKGGQMVDHLHIHLIGGGVFTSHTGLE
jgi:histidine triad (HIT) family protein